MRDLLQRSVLVIEVSLLVILVDVIAYAASVVSQPIAGLAGGLAYFGVGLGFTLFWIANGERGLGTT